MVMLDGIWVSARYLGTSVVEDMRYASMREPLPDYAVSQVAVLRTVDTAKCVSAIHTLHQRNHSKKYPTCTKQS